ncbi:hypothetical protein ACLOJK_029438 [Asimina triloba]
MQGMNVRFIHQFREGNQAADFLAKLGESSSSRIYEDLQDLPRLLQKAFTGLGGKGRGGAVVEVQNCSDLNQTQQQCSFACSLLRQGMQQITITLDTLGIQALEKQGDKSAIATTFGEILTYKTSPWPANAGSHWDLHGLRFGTGKVGYSFAPAMVIWFLTIGVIDLYNVVQPQRIVHFDIKPQNILLDDDFNAKVLEGAAEFEPNIGYKFCHAMVHSPVYIIAVDSKPPQASV